MKRKGLFSLLFGPRYIKALPTLKIVFGRISLLFLTLVTLQLHAQYDQLKWKKNVHLDGNVSTQSGMATDQYGRVYYVDQNTKKIMIQDPDNWFNVLCNTAPNARTSTNIVYKDDAVYYVNENNRISSISWNGSSWVPYTYTCQSTNEAVAPGTSISVVASNNILYIRDSDKRVCQYWDNGSACGFGPIMLSATPAAAWSNIHFVDNHAWYIGNDLQIHYLKWTGSSWQHGQKTTDPLNIGSEIYAQNEDQIFYINFSDQICSVWYNGTTSGYGPILQDANDAIMGSGLLLKDNHFYYVDKSKNINVLYWNWCKWTKSVLNESATTRLNNYKFAFHNDQIFYEGPGAKIESITREPYLTDYVYRQGEDLMLNGEKFNSTGVVYLTSLYRRPNGTFYIGPHTNNTFPTPNYQSNESQSQTNLQNHIQEIASLGFTSVRFNGLQLTGNKNNLSDPNIYFNVWNSSTWSFDLVKLDDVTQPQILAAWDNLVALCAQNGLKVNIFPGLDQGNNTSSCHTTYINYLEDLADHFKNNSTVYAYSYLLEPDINPGIKDKCLIKGYSESFYDAIRSFDPNHLITIGITGLSSAFHWDPAIMKFDFLTVHSYPANFSTTYRGVKRTLKWTCFIADKMDVPWILGETGFKGIIDGLNTAPSATGTEEEQRSYGQFILDYAFGCGSSGLQWWSFHDHYWWGDTVTNENHFGLHRFMGYGVYTQQEPKLIITNNIFHGYTPPECSTCPIPANYYSDGTGTNIIWGFVKDQNGNPIEGAVIFPYQSASISFGITDANGFYSMVISIAPGGIGLNAASLGKMGSYSFITTDGRYDFVLYDVMCKSKIADNPDQFGLTSDVSENDQVFLYPNPTTGMVYFMVPAEEFSIEISNAMGEVVLREDKVSHSVDLKGMPKGIYWVEIIHGDQSTVKKLVLVD